MFIVTITQNNLSLGVNLKPKKTRNATTQKLKRSNVPLISHNKVEFANSKKHKFETLKKAKEFASKFDGHFLVNIREKVRQRHK